MDIEQRINVVNKLLERKIPDEYNKILKSFGIELKEEQYASFLDSNEPLCSTYTNQKKSPLTVALQIFYSTLHPSFKGNDLDLSSFPENFTADTIIKYGLYKITGRTLGFNEKSSKYEEIEDNFEFIKKLGFKNYSNLFKNVFTDKIFESEKSKKNLLKLSNNGGNIIIKYIGDNHNSLYKILEDDNLFQKLLDYSNKNDGLNILKYIGKTKRLWTESP